MEFFKSNTTIGFMAQRRWAAVFSTLLMLASVLALLVNGLNLGLDFTGGTQVIMHFPTTANTDHIRDTLVNTGFKKAVVTSYGTSETVSIKVASNPARTADQTTKKILQSFPKGQVQQSAYIGPQVGKTLLTNGVLAIIVSLLATIIYIALRFELRFAVSSAIALIHDPVLILGIFSALHLEFNLIVLAAVLTVIGYSLNDTIVVYDRVRENFQKIRKRTPSEIMDLSINQTLSRTIMTSGLTLLVVLVLYFFGGETIHNFSLALIIGIIIGTYSSIYVAGSLAIGMGLTRESLVPTQRTDDGSP
jgi:preprotein translocase subunit SecF